MEGESIRGINRTSRFKHSAASKERDRTLRTLRAWVVQVSESCGRLCSFFDALHFLFWAFYGETLLSTRHVKDIRTDHFIKSARSHRLR